MTATDDPRQSRQKGIIPPDRLARTHAVVVGVGAVGRQVSLMLASTGVPRLTLIDPDTVEDVNLGPQMYREQDLGRPKVDATGLLVAELNAESLISNLAERFRKSSVQEYLGNLDEYDACVFCCVDSIETRGHVFEAVKKDAAFFADARVASQVVRVLCGHGPAFHEYYPSTLFPEAEAQGGACTARMTVYLAAVAAGLMLSGWAKWLRGQEPSRDLTLNLMADELSVQ
jgi:molybdopterin/thiamine biosynthesis adenylyltransferase